MTQRTRDPQIAAFLEAVCNKIKDKHVHGDVSEELESHLAELAAMKVEQGTNKHEAIAWALRQMGDPLVIGTQLQQVYKPRVRWSLLGLLCVFIIVGLAAMYAIQLSYAAQWRTSLQNISFVRRQGAFYASGIALLSLLYLFDYRKLQRYSWMLYAGTVVIMALGNHFNYRVNGRPVMLLGLGSWHIDITSISPYLLVVALAGLHPFLLRRGLKIWCLQFAVCVALPCLLYIETPSIAALITYMVGYMTILAAIRTSWLRAASQLVIPVVAYIGYVLVSDFNHHVIQRLQGFFFRTDPNGESWQYIQTELAIRSAGWWGRGFAAVNDRLPFIHAESVYPYLIYSLGWMMGIFIFVLAALWIATLAATAKQTSEPYGKLLVGGIASIFAVQFVWNIGMSFGLMPITAMPLPFISYGGSQIMAQLVSCGLILSVYKHKQASLRTSPRL